MKRIDKKIILFAGIALLVITCLVFILLYFGVIHLNNPSRSEYPVRGVDVSHHQGEIDWKRLAEQDIRFAFIKATEGSKYTDECFEKNWKESRDVGLRVGAYHFFSLDSSGKKQAKNFCSVVEGFNDMLPPVVDVEPYGKYSDPDILDKAKMLSELGEYVDIIEKKYDQRPIIYTTEEWLSVLLEEFADYDIWIRSVYGKPDASVKWTFWQFSNRHVLDGYSGTERYIDMNVFSGNEADFYDYR